MRILITIKQSPARRYLIYLLTKNLVSRVTDLVKNNRHREACLLALERGVVIGRVANDELHEVQADLILSETNARWDLVRSNQSVI